MAFDGMDGMTLRSLWEKQAEVYGDREFLIFRTREGAESGFSYGQFDRLVNRTANLFTSLGVEKGDTVAVHLCNCVEFMLCLFGLAKIGGVMVPVNEQNREAESAFVLERCRARVLVVDCGHVEMYREIVAAGHGCVHTILSVDGVEGLEDAESLIDFDRELFAHSAKLQTDVTLESSDVAEVMYTSGTTSDPKGVEFTHANFLYAGYYTQWQVLMREDDCLLTSMPACHSNFQLAAMMPVIVAGARLVMVEKYSASRFWSQVRYYDATIIQCVSMMVRTLLMQPVDPQEKDNHVREVLYFLPLDTREKEAFEERFDVRIMNSYGSTESLTWAITDYPSGERRWPSVGRVGLGYRAKVVDEDGRELPCGEVGEIVIWGIPGRTIMKGYYEDPEKTAQTIDEDGWLYTGDKGYVDEEGFFYFVDRKANMIKRGGENISASEVEEAIEQHPLVAEAAVIGVPDPIRDQAVKAFVVPLRGSHLSEEEIRAHCESLLAAFKVPEFIEIRDSLPHTCSLKVEKKKLR